MIDNARGSADCVLLRCGRRPHSAAQLGAEAQVSEEGVQESGLPLERGSYALRYALWMDVKSAHLDRWVRQWRCGWSWRQ